MRFVDRAAYLRTTTFRLTVLSAALFAAAAGLIVFYVYGATANTLAGQTNRALESEVGDLQGSFRMPGGPNALNQEVVRRSFSDEFLYIFAHETGGHFSGNLDAMPAALEVDAEPSEFEYARAGEEGEPAEVRTARGMIVSFDGGYRLLVARDVTEDVRVVDRVAREAWTATVFIVILGLVTGGFLSWRFSSRLEDLNAVARDVMAGDLRRRAPRNYSGDELDALAGNLNEMLDRIERLMASMRYAGDAVAHDLRSPLTRLRNRLEASLREVEGEAKETIESTIEDADVLLSTFNSVLRLSRLESGEQRAELVRLDLSEVASDVAELYEPACEDAGLDFRVDIASGLYVRADRTLVSQALANLMDNAVKYTPEGGAVTLAARRIAPDRVELSVADTGPGIPDFERARVRQRFVRLEASRSEPGTGLGLSLVEAVAKIHGAEFILEDAAPESDESESDESGADEPDRENRGLRAALIFPARV
ncbi:MAG: HAMP domain-containing sensor histidine kinase [Maricaulaceae bacterium]|jgi:signal transduction histidine kinase